ncbi:MAG: hypothetical protein AAFV43_16650 [Planctomycetota bacterium]
MTNQDFFGTSVAIYGELIAVGATGDKTSGSAVGQVHLFNATTGQLERTFGDPTVTDADRFGSVAIDGSHVLIGARTDDTNGINVGQAHLFDSATGNLLQTFDDPTPTSTDLFGGSVAIGGAYAVIGASGDDTTDLDVGQAHLFDTASGNLLRTFDYPRADDSSLAGGAFFGRSVAIDGDNILIGADGPRLGARAGDAFLFDAETGDLLQTFDDPTGMAGTQFGWSVAIENDTVLIGAPGDDTNGSNVGKAHLFDAATGNLLRTFDDPTVTSNDQFGWSVAIDGNHVLVGAFGDDTTGVNVGQAHLFDANTGALLQIFNDPTVTDRDLFGQAVAIDGANVVIGAFRDDTNGNDVGQAYLFDANQRTPGDFSGDGFVDNDDLNLLLNNWGDSAVNDGWKKAVDAPVDNAELNALLVDWGFGAPAGLATASGGPPLVPEPGAASLVVLAFAITRRGGPRCAG